MIIGLLRPTETDCWWGMNGSMVDNRRPCLPGTVAVAGTARGRGGGRCVSGTAMGEFLSLARRTAGLEWWTLVLERRGAGGVSWLAL